MEKYSLEFLEISICALDNQNKNERQQQQLHKLDIGLTAQFGPETGSVEHYTLQPSDQQ